MSHNFKLFIALLTLTVVPLLSGCNTARGFGEDIQALGRALSGTAEEVKDDASGKPEEATQ